MEILHEWVAATLRARDLKDQWEDAKRVADGLKEEVVLAMTDAGLESVRTESGTVYIKEDVWASAVDHARLAEALDRLEAAGEDRLAGMVSTSVNGQSLSARVREFRREHWELPTEVADLIKITVNHVPQLRAK